MKHFDYVPQGVCSQHISFDMDGDIVKNVQFVGGCNGNLKAISALVEGLPAEKVVETIGGIRCGMKQTSCGDQLARAISEAIKA